MTNLPDSNVINIESHASPTKDVKLLNRFPKDLQAHDHEVSKIKYIMNFQLYTIQKKGCFEWI